MWLANTAAALASLAILISATVSASRVSKSLQDWQQIAESLTAVRHFMVKTNCSSRSSVSRA